MKTESSKRALPLLPEVEKILLEHREMQEEYRRLYRRDYSKQYLDMVCVDPPGNLIRPNYISERFPKMLKKNGLPRIRFHDLRHSCASMLIAHKAGMKQVQMWMGHSSITTTMDTYIDKAESLDPSIQLPSGLFSSRKPKTHHKESSVIAPCIIHQKPSDDFRDWISDEWYDIEEMLPLKDVPKLIGYNVKTIQRWAHQKALKTVWHQNHLFTTRDWVIDFLATEGYKVQNKSLLHTRLLLQYYNYNQ